MFLKLSTWKRGSDSSGILSPFLGFENAGGDVFTVVLLASFYFLLLSLDSPASVAFLFLQCLAFVCLCGFWLLWLLWFSVSLPC